MKIGLSNGFTTKIFRKSIFLEQKASGKLPEALCLFAFSIMMMGQTSILNADNLFLVVAAAGLANPMGHHQSSAFAALYQIACAHFPIGSALISSGLGRPILWANRHGLHLLKLLKYILDYRHPRIWRTAFTGTGPVV